eukprot:scaffold61486_cov28-Tisochrysis_lutea.AAC.6
MSHRTSTCFGASRPPALLPCLAATASCQFFLSQESTPPRPRLTFAQANVRFCPDSIQPDCIP